MAATPRFYIQVTQGVQYRLQAWTCILLTDSTIDSEITEVG
jgi:hypothetical protein